MTVLWLLLAVSATATIVIPSAGAWLMLLRPLIVATGAAFAVWVYQDAAKHYIKPLLWSLSTLVVWPVALPAYLLHTRKSKGIAPSVAVVAQLGLIAAMMTVTVSPLNRSRAKADAYYAKAADSGANKAEVLGKALDHYEQMLSINENVWDVYAMVFFSAYYSGRGAEAASYYKKLVEKKKKYARGERAFWEIHTAILTYNILALGSAIGVAERALEVGIADEAEKQLRDMLRYGNVMRQLKSERDTAMLKLDESSRSRFSKRIEFIDTTYNNFSIIGEQSLESASKLVAMIDKSPEGREAFLSYARGMAAFSDKNNKDAQDAFSKAIRLAPDFDSALLMLAQVRMRQARWDEAAKLAGRAAISVEHDGSRSLRSTRRQLAQASATQAYAIFNLAVQSRSRADKSDRKKNLADAALYFAAATESINRACKLDAQAPYVVEIAAMLKSRGIRCK
ncbi:MAG: tetratricopeptide repeat protein [Elusimicrobiales bacterium]